VRLLKVILENFVKLADQNNQKIILMRLLKMLLSTISGKHNSNPYCFALCGCGYHNCMDTCNMTGSPICLDPNNCCCYPVEVGKLNPN
jgi:hypothetical protein